MKIYDISIGTKLIDTTNTVVYCCLYLISQFMIEKYYLLKFTDALSSFSRASETHEPQVNNCPNLPAIHSYKAYASSFITILNTYSPVTHSHVSQSNFKRYPTNFHSNTKRTHVTVYW